MLDTAELLRRNGYPIGDPWADLPVGRPVSVRQIKVAVARHYGIARSDLDSDCRAYVISHPRQLAMYLARELTPLSLPNIGRQFRRDHSTVFQACRAVADRLLVNGQAAEAARSIKLALRAGVERV